MKFDAWAMGLSSRDGDGGQWVRVKMDGWMDEFRHLTGRWIFVPCEAQQLRVAGCGLMQADIDVDVRSGGAI
jgi:hypothetical protein